MLEVGFEPTKHIAVDLKSTPFDRSGTPAVCYFIYYNICIFLSILYRFIYITNISKIFRIFLQFISYILNYRLYRVRCNICSDLVYGDGLVSPV